MTEPTPEARVRAFIEAMRLGVPTDALLASDLVAVLDDLDAARATIEAAPHAVSCEGWHERPWEGGNWPIYDFVEADCTCWKANA